MRRTTHTLCTMAMILAAAPMAGADTLYWDGNGDTTPDPTGPGTWSTSGNANWNTASDYTGTYGDWDQAGGQDVALLPFLNTGSTVNTITVSGTVSANEIRMEHSNSGQTRYEFTGGAIELTGAASVGSNDPGGGNPGGHWFIFNTTITGSNGLHFDTRQNAELNVANSYTGNTTIGSGGGHVAINHNDALPDATILQSGSLGGSLTIADGVTATVSGIEGDFDLSGSSASTSSTATLVLDRAAGSSTYTGQSTGRETHLVKQGAYTQTWSGSGASNRLLSFTMDGGLFVLDKPDNVEALASTRDSSANPTQVFLTSGTLRLDSHEQIQDTAPVTFQGGTFDLNGFNETLGGLTLTANSTLAFGAPGSSGIVTFDSLDVTGGELLINGWNGSEAGGGDHQLRFISDPTAFADAIVFAGGLGSNVIDFGSHFEVVAIPEPAGLALLALGGLAMLPQRPRGERRRLSFKG